MPTGARDAGVACRTPLPCRGHLLPCGGRLPTSWSRLPLLDASPRHCSEPSRCRRASRRCQAGVACCHAACRHADLTMPEPPTTAHTVREGYRLPLPPATRTHICRRSAPQRRQPENPHILDGVMWSFRSFHLSRHVISSCRTSSAAGHSAPLTLPKAEARKRTFWIE